MTFEKLLRKIRTRLGIRLKPRSETSKVRHMVIDYCQGYGCDIGFGGDKIKKIDCVGIDFAQPQTSTGGDKVDIACDLMNEPIPVADSTFDYVYTSHLIEDFVDTTATLQLFIRILKSGGTLLLAFPDQRKYEDHCRKTGQPLNMRHIHKDMGLEFMLDKIKKVPGINYTILLENNCEIDYNVVIILKITKNGIAKKI